MEGREEAMTTLSQITSFTRSAAVDTVRLYFEPITFAYRAASSFLRGATDSENRAAYIERAQKDLEELLSEQLKELTEREICSRIKHRRVFLTGAGHPAARTILEDIVSYDPESVLLVDGDVAQLERTWREIAHSFPQERTAFLSGDLTNADWFCSLAASHHAEVIIDFTAHPFIRRREPRGKLSDLRAQRAHMQRYERAEVLLNVMECSANVPTVESLFLVFPEHLRSEAQDAVTRLEDVLLRHYAVSVGVRRVHSKPLLTVWTPRRAEAVAR